MFIWRLSLNGLVAQWIRHRPTEPGIAGSSPAEVNCIWSHAAPIDDANSHCMTLSQCMDTRGHALKNMRMPGIEPGAQAWETCMLPLRRCRVIAIPNKTIGLRCRISPRCTLSQNGYSDTITAHASQTTSPCPPIGPLWSGVRRMGSLPLCSNGSASTWLLGLVV